MKYKPKDYFYYFLMENSDVFKNSLFKGDDLINLLGDFYVSRFSLKLVDDKKRDYKDRFIVTDSFKPENKNMEMGSFSIENNNGSFTFTGILNNTNIINLFILNDRSKGDKFGLEFTIVNNKEMIFYSSNIYINDSYESVPGYAYYDNEVIDSLKEVGYSLNDISKMRPRDLVKMGIEPDVFSFTSNEELGFKDQSEFGSRLLRDLSYNDIKDKFEKIDVDKEETVQFLKKYSRVYYKTKFDNEL